MKHLLAASDLTKEEIQKLLATAKAFAPAFDRGETIPLLQNKTIVNLFFENSTRTRTSFEIATRRLGGIIQNFAASTSSTQKGETLIDTARTIEAMKANCFVIRHSSAGSPSVLAHSTNVAVINAGDGFHEHPTQALLDAYTIQEKLGTIEGKKILILGDIAHSRAARSNIYVLKKLGASITVCGPPTLLPPKPETLGVEAVYRLEKVLPQADVVMALRIQLERQNRHQLPSIAEYSRVWGLNKERAKLIKKGAIIMAPGPVNRGVEIDPEVADGPTSVILDQVSNGVLVRMAVLATICNPEGLAKWLQAQGGIRV